MPIRFSPSMLIMTASIFLVCVILMSTSAAALEYPSPPPVPKKFDSPEDVQRYLNQLHNYYMVVGRPRFGKRSGADLLENSINSLLKNQANGEQNENRPETEVDESITQYDFDGVGNNDRLLKAKVLKYLIRED